MITGTKLTKQTVTLSRKQGHWLLGRQLESEFRNLLRRWVSRKESLTESHPLVCSFSLQELWHMRRAGRLYCSLYPFFPSLSHNLHYPMLITHLDSPTFLPALLSYRAGIRSMDKTRKDNSSFNGLVLFLLSYYLVHKFHLKKCPDMGRSRCH